jgi:dynein heavy chain
MVVFVSACMTSASSSYLLLLTIPLSLLLLLLPGISPQAGPVYGETEMTIKGLRFKPGKVQVRFGNTEKTQLLVDAEYVDNETIKCKTANYEQFGATAVDVTVSINGEGWTVNKLSYSYFANTSARNCTAFGPGVLPNVVFGVGVPFLIQARDTLNERRTSGGDHFAVRVVSTEGGLQGDAVIVDSQDGRYEVTSSVPRPGVYLVHVNHADLGGSEAVAIRGSPFKVEAADPWVKHRVLGAIPAKRTVSG